MLHFSSPRTRIALARALFVVMLGALGGCRDTGDITGSIAPAAPTLPTSDADLRAYADNLGKKYDANPGDKAIAMNYAAALRALTRYSQAAAVMQAVRSRRWLSRRHGSH